jgi:TP901 family phage tail tape measure protein
VADGSLVFDTKVDESGFKKGLNRLKSIGGTALKAVGKAAVAVGTAVSALGGYALKASIDFESAFAGVRKTVDATEEEFKMLEKGIRDMSKRMPQTASEIAQVAEAAGQLGIETKNILGFTETMVMLGDATNMTSEQAATALARLANITRMPQSEFDRLGSTIVALGNNLATTEAEIVEMGLRLAGTASQVGMTEAQILALAGAMSSVGINAEAGGSSMSRVIQKINTEVLSSGKNLQKFAEIAGMSAEEFSKAWRERPQEAILAFVQGLDKLNKSGGDVTSTLKDLKINSIQEIDTLLRLAGASEVLADSLKLGEEAWKENIALQNEAEQRYQTTESLIRILKNNIDDLAISVGDELKESARGGIGTAIEMVEQLANALETRGLAGLVEELGTVFADIATKATQMAPALIEAGANMIMSFISGIQENLPSIVKSALSIAQTLITSILEMLPQLVQLGAELLVALITGIAEMLPSLMTQIIDTVILVADTIIANLPMLIEAGLQLLMALAEGIINNLPKLIEEVPRIINSFADAIYSNLPKILATGVKIMIELIKGLIQSIPTLVANLPQIIMAIVNAFTLYNWWNLGKGVITKLGDGIKSMAKTLAKTAKSLAENPIQAIKDVFSGAPKIGQGLVEHIRTGIQLLAEQLVITVKNLGTRTLNGIKGIFSGAKDIGINLVKGLWNGIDNMVGWILDKIKGFGQSIMNGIKKVFGIASPSKLMRDEIGKNLTLGIGVGLEEGMPELQRDVDKELSRLTAKMKATVEFESANIGARIAAGNGKNIGERVIETINDNSDNSTVITGNTFIIRQESDIEKVAQELDRLRTRRGRGRGLGVALT